MARAGLALRDPDALREAAENDAAATGDEELAVDLLITASLIRRKRNDLEGAARDAEAALERAPWDPRAANVLAAALEPRGKRTQLADLLARAADRASDAERRAALYMQSAALRAPVDLNAAIATCERALVVGPDHPGVLTRLASYLERAREWPRAAESLSKLAEVAPSADERCDAHLSLAEIAIERLGDHERALPSLTNVLEARPDDRRALGLQGQLFAKLGRLDEACAIAERLVEATHAPTERADVLVQAARVMERCDRQADAQQAFLEALALQGHAGEAARVYRARVAEDKGSWPAYTEALSRYVHEATTHELNAAPTVRAIAEIQLREQGAPEQAFKTLVMGLGRWPGEPGLNLDFARVLEAMGEYDEALRVYREQLALHPASASLWQGLSSVQRAQGSETEALSAGLPLLLLDGVAGQDLLQLKLRTPRPAAAQPGTLNDAMLRSIDREQMLASPIVDLVRVLGGPLSEVLVPDLGRFGLSRRERVEHASEPALWDAVERVAGLLTLGTDAFDLYVHDKPELHVSVALTEPPSLLVPRAVATQPAPAKLGGDAARRGGASRLQSHSLVGWQEGRRSNRSSR